MIHTAAMNLFIEIPESFRLAGSLPPIRYEFAGQVKAFDMADLVANTFLAGQTEYSG